MDNKKYIFSIIVVLFFALSISVVSATDECSFKDIKKTVYKDIKTIFDNTQYDDDFILYQPHVNIQSHRDTCDNYGYMNGGNDDLWVYKGVKTIFDDTQYDDDFIKYQPHANIQAHIDTNGDNKNTQNDDFVGYQYNPHILDNIDTYDNYDCMNCDNNTV